MPNFTLTVFDKSGETLLDETFGAKDESEAKKAGEKRLKEEGYEQHTSRMVSSAGKLVLFHR
ncbi:MAG TPA: YhzD family protein [Bacillales bacterium]|nr:YhzD family protein [Bacillales bacterium]